MSPLLRNVTLFNNFLASNVEKHKEGDTHEAKQSLTVNEGRDDKSYKMTNAPMEEVKGGNMVSERDQDVSKKQQSFYPDESSKQTGVNQSKQNSIYSYKIDSKEETKKYDSMIEKDSRFKESDDEQDEIEYFNDDLEKNNLKYEESKTDIEIKLSGSERVIQPRVNLFDKEVSEHNKSSKSFKGSIHTPKEQKSVTRYSEKPSLNRLESDEEDEDFAFKADISKRESLFQNNKIEPSNRESIRNQESEIEENKDKQSEYNDYNSDNDFYGGRMEDNTKEAEGIKDNYDRDSSFEKLDKNEGVKQSTQKSIVQDMPRYGNIEAPLIEPVENPQSERLETSTSVRIEVPETNRDEIPETNRIETQESYRKESSRSVSSKKQEHDKHKNAEHVSQEIPETNHFKTLEPARNEIPEKARNKTLEPLRMEALNSARKFDEKIKGKEPIEETKFNKEEPKDKDYTDDLISFEEEKFEVETPKAQEAKTTEEKKLDYESHNEDFKEISMSKFSNSEKLKNDDSFDGERSSENEDDYNNNDFIESDKEQSHKAPTQKKKEYSDVEEEPEIPKIKSKVAL